MQRCLGPVRTHAGQCLERLLRPFHDRAHGLVGLGESTARVCADTGAHQGRPLGIYGVIKEGLHRRDHLQHAADDLDAPVTRKAGLGVDECVAGGDKPRCLVQRELVQRLRVFQRGRRGIDEHLHLAGGIGARNVRTGDLGLETNDVREGDGRPGHRGPGTRGVRFADGFVDALDRRVERSQRGRRPGQLERVEVREDGAHLVADPAHVLLQLAGRGMQVGKAGLRRGAGRPLHEGADARQLLEDVGAARAVRITVPGRATRGRRPTSVAVLLEFRLLSRRQSFDRGQP